MRRELLLVLPILAAVLSVLPLGSLNSVAAQNMTGNESMMTTNMTNATMGGNVTGGNVTGGNWTSPTNMTAP
jgi:hypothetical protein